MAWEWIELEDLTGVQATTDISWDTVLNAIINDTTISSIRSTNFNGTSNDYTYVPEDGGSKTISTNWGFDLIYTSDGWSGSFKLAYNNNIIWNTATLMDRKMTCRFAINHETQKASIGVIYISQDRWTSANIMNSFSDYQTTLYNIIMGHIPPEYIWHSVKSISGQLGTFRFSSLPDDVLTGDTITGLREEDFETWNQQTSFFDLAVGTPIGTTIMALCSGNNNPLNLTVNESGLFVWNFFVD